MRKRLVLNNSDSKNLQLRRTIDKEITAVPDRGGNTPITELADSYRKAGAEEQGEFLNAVREIATESWSLDQGRWIALIGFIECSKMSIDNLNSALQSTLRRWPVDASVNRLVGVVCWLAGKDIKIPMEVLNSRAFSRLKQARPWSLVDALALHGLRHCVPVLRGMFWEIGGPVAVADHLKMRFELWHRAGKGKEVRFLSARLLRMKPLPPSPIKRVLKEAAGKKV